MNERTEVRGWRAECLSRLLANAWEAAADGRGGSAEYWFADATHVLATARVIENVDGSRVWS